MMKVKANFSTCRKQKIGVFKMLMVNAPTDILDERVIAFSSNGMIFLGPSEVDFVG